MSPKLKSNQFFFHLYKPLFVVMQIFGYNVRLTKNIPLQIGINIYTLFLVVIVSCSVMTCCQYQEISLVWSLLEYVIFVVVMMFYKTKIYLFLRKLYDLDVYLRIRKRYYYSSRLKMFIVIIATWMVGVAHSITFCCLHVCYTSLLKFIIYQLCLLALHVIRVWRYSIFEIIWRRLRLLKVRMEENPENDYFMYVKDNKLVKEDKMKLCLVLYRNIGDLLDIMSPELNASILASVMCSLPKLIVNVYKILLVIDNSLGLETLGFMLTHILQTFLFVFSPCVAVELCGAEVDSIQRILMHRILDEKDPETKEHLQLFLQYTNLRPFRYRVWRSIPMGVTLPLDIINICTTYVIVIVNFTKVFEN